MGSEGDDVTLLLRAWAQGDEAARNAVMPLVYGELRRIAQKRISDERFPTLDATGLAHAAFIRLGGQHRVDWQNRRQFYALAAKMMRRVLVDRHRKRAAQRRGGDRVRVSFSAAEATPDDALDFVALNDALQQLTRQDSRQASIVELRFFGGLSVDEVAAVLEVSASTIKREWVLARAWLKRELDSAS